ncbi:MAG TPA: ATP-binding protein [Caulobacteraceae bacterium]|nr:ATP-binding protein [Caulobacteraceae bacterium]
MAERSTPDGAGLGARAPDDAATRLFLASSRNIPIRLATGAAIAVAAVPLAGPWLAVAWWGVLALMALLETRVANAVRSGWRLPVWEEIPLPTVAMSIVTGTVYTLFMALFWQSDLPIAKAFAMAQTSISVLYVLLQYYARPKVFLCCASPYLAGVAAAVGSMAARTVQAGQPWLVVTAVIGLGLICNLFINARRQLAGSREALRQARAAAQERGVAAEAANDAKSAFLATMSHEIRTPLNGVLGLAQAMAADALSKVQRERLEMIRQSGETLLAILNDVLDLSRIEAGRFELETVEFELGELMRGAHSAFTALANKKGLSFDLTIEPSARGVYMGDPTRVRQILYNLISNALKFTEHGDVRVTATRGDGVLELKVSDTGIGVSADRVKALFEKFTQADATITRRYGGAGLGLAICRELAQLMGGEISAESELGAGSTFTVRLPLEMVRESHGSTFVMPAESAGAEPARLDIRVLAAEDNSVNQLVLKTLLHQIGVDPVMVENGQEALDAWTAQHWDVILMDMQMPVMDGLTATRCIREAEADTGRPRTPIVALTANAMAHQVQACLAAGMDGHLPKPVEAARLFAALVAALDEGEEPAESSVA